MAGSRSQLMTRWLSQSTAALLISAAGISSEASAADTAKAVRIVRVEAAPKLEDYLSGTGPGAHGCWPADPG